MTLKSQTASPLSQQLEALRLLTITVESRDMAAWDCLISGLIVFWLKATLRVVLAAVSLLLQEFAIHLCALVLA